MTANAKSKGVAWLVLVMFVLALVPSPASAQVLTHYILNPVVELEVDVDSRGVVTAMRYTFSESDPADAVTPTLGVKQTPPQPAASAQMSVQVEAEAKVKEAVTATAGSSAVCELLAQMKNLVQKDLDSLARITKLPLTETAATRAAQTSLVIGGGATAKLGAQL